ncbi:translation initiation factor IF-2-like [Artibeus jamaicensis]|uniref:translation initiation factor IF-2-like n=1 Tax=Artibeus jamaicensis TaxID=9417 RepID=UPI00235A8D43|nr:translation initiation factor IF-2-like [Artibeus jamaicensis]
MSNREAPLLHGGRPDPYARRRPLCPSLLPPALSRSAHAGAAPPPPPGACRGLSSATRLDRPDGVVRGGAKGRNPRRTGLPARGLCTLSVKAENQEKRTGGSGLLDPQGTTRLRDSAPSKPSASWSQPADDQALPAAALPGRRPRPAAPRHRRDLSRPAPGSRPPREGVGRGGGRRTLPSPRGAGPGPRSSARDRQVTEVLCSAAKPSCFPGADFSLLPP